MRPIPWVSQIDATGYALNLEPPGTCIEDCSAPGERAEAVAYWIKALGFNSPEAGTKAYLKATGAWDLNDLEDHGQNLERLLWLICCDLREKYLDEA
jgi:hypothetical protein